MDHPPHQLTPSEMAAAFQQQLIVSSTYSQEIVSQYEKGVRLNKPRDSKFIQLVERALAFRTTQDNNGPETQRNTPVDLASIVEMWQEKDRHNLTSPDAAAAPRPLDPETPDAILQVMSRRQLSQLRSSTPQRYLTLAVPYLPCTRELQDLQAVNLADLKLASHNRGTFVSLKRTGPLTRHQTGVLTGVVDGTAAAYFLELTCTNPGIEEALLHDDAAFAVKEPFVTTGRDVSWCIRVDHPTDIVRVSRLLELDTGKTPSEWKVRGNALYKERQLGAAAAAYEEGLLAVSEGDPAIRRDLHRNLSQTYLSLGFWERARSHAHQALHFTAAHDDPATSQGPRDSLSSVPKSDTTKPTGHIKALYRDACAAYQLQDFALARDSLQKLLKLAPNHDDGRRELLKVLRRLNEVQNGAYDLDEILSVVTPQEPFVDAASFTRRTTVSQSAGKGNGLFADEDAAIGDLVLCEKAFAADFSIDPAKEPLRTYDTVREIFNAIPAALWVSAVEKVVKNPSLGSQLLALGGSHAGLGSQDIRAEGARVVDVFQVHDIVSRNSFGIPTPSASAKTQQWGLYTSQSGAESRTNLAPRNSAIFCRAACINHSCIPNVEKRFIGDIIIIRAARPIAKGAEILLDYAPGEFNDVRSRKPGFERTWQFSCDCLLCVAESTQADEILDQRISLIKEADKLSEVLSSNMPSSIYWNGDITRLVGLLMQLGATYSQSELPKSLAYTYTTLAVLYGAQKHFRDHVQMIGEAFESLGWHSPLETGGMLLPRPHPAKATVLDLNVSQLLNMACLAASATGDLKTRDGIKKVEPQVYMALNGTMNGFQSIDKRMGGQLGATLGSQMAGTVVKEKRLI